MLRILSLLLALIATPALAQLPGSSQPTNNGLWNDRSAIIANQTNFFTHASRFNRLMIGEQSLQSMACHGSPNSWIQTLFGGTCESGQLAVTSTLGTFGITAAARTSDFRTWKGAASQGTSAISAFGVNDDTGAGFPIVDTLNLEAVVMPGVSGATLTGQFNVDNVCCTYIADPYSGFAVANLLLTPGGTPPSGFSVDLDVDAALIIGNASGAGGNPHFQAGIVIQNDSIKTGVGPTVNGAGSTVGMSMQSNYAIVWFTSANTSSGAIYSGTAGKLNLWAPSDINLNAGNGSANISINAGGAGGILINGTTAVSCNSGTVNAGTLVVKNGIVTHC